MNRIPPIDETDLPFFDETDNGRRVVAQKMPFEF